MIRILHLDDEMAMPLALSRALKLHADVPTELVALRTERELHEHIKRHLDGIDCIIVDLSFQDRLQLAEPRRNGIDVIRDLRGAGFSRPVVMLSASDDPVHMSLAMTAGASDYLSKADPIVQICQCLVRCVQTTRDLGLVPRQRKLPPGVVGETMRLLASRLDRVLQTGLSPVLIRGESGTGKEAVADLLESLLRDSSEARTLPFIRVNCATLQGELLESELFGHEKGAFTGADRARVGLFESAAGGWIFLDEVAKLSPRAQASLLRVLESGEIRPIGASKSKRVDVRVMAATNENLERLCESEEFRFDLLARLQGYVVELPPYRERSVAERMEIIDHLLDRLSRQSRSYSLANAVRQMFLKAPFPQSNIRELWHVLQAATVESVDGVIGVSSLPRYFLERMATLGSREHEFPASGFALAPVPRSAESQPGFERLLESAQLNLEYADLELFFFEAVLKERRLLNAEGQFESVRKISDSLSLGRHVVSRKIDALREMKNRRQNLG